MNEVARKTFRVRSNIISYIREFMNIREFLEVETPMMQAIPGGAVARPFVTHHHALDIEMFLRIAPELYLKRLIVGGFERVYEINRNFRNEGLSTRHNPEFTMPELYQAYADYHDLMNLTEEMLRGLAEHVFGGTTVTYQGEQYDFGKRFERLTLKEAVQRHNPKLAGSDLERWRSCRPMPVVWASRSNPATASASSSSKFSRRRWRRSSRNPLSSRPIPPRSRRSPGVTTKTLDR